jgi:chromosomal replication initiation ATPase DnaA
MMLSLFDLLDGYQNNLFLEKPFVATRENALALQIINNFIASPINYLPPAMVLIGSEGSGKTHLLHHLFSNNILSNNAKSHFIDMNNFFIDGFSKNYLISDVANNFYIIENCQQFNIGNKQEKLLHLINFIIENRGFIVLSSNILPNFSLADLQSRIVNFCQANIDNPSAETAKILIANQMANRQIKINRNLLAQLEKYQDFTYRQINDLAKMLNFFCQEKKKMPNLQEFNNILQSQKQL